MDGAIKPGNLENLKKLDASGIPFFIRTPLVPGINDNETEIQAMDDFSASLKNLKKYELLPYHSMASCKYDNLNLENPMGKTKDLSKERLDYFQKMININKNL